MLFGSGGQLVEVYKDSALALPPLNATLARRMMEQTKIYTALKGVRGRKSVDLPGMEKLLVRFSQLIAEQRWIKEVDINPLLASPEKLIALDARVVLFAKDTPEEKLPKLAIRPYPTQYISKTKIKNGRDVVIRPIRPEDEPALIAFHEKLSERTVKLRYFCPDEADQPAWPTSGWCRVCHNDFDREMALVAETYDAKTKEYAVLGVGRLSKTPGVATRPSLPCWSRIEWQNQGLGTELLRKLIEIGKAEKLETISAEMMSENSRCRRSAEARVQDGRGQGCERSRSCRNEAVSFCGRDLGNQRGHRARRRGLCPLGIGVEEGATKATAPRYCECLRVLAIGRGGLRDQAVAGEVVLLLGWWGWGGEVAEGYGAGPRA